MNLLDTTACLHLLLTLGHFAWQATLILLVAALARVILFRRSAAGRYGVLLAALLLHYWVMRRT